jgi:hypothetical protein
VRIGRSDSRRRTGALRIQRAQSLLPPPELHIPRPTEDPPRSIEDMVSKALARFHQQPSSARGRTDHVAGCPATLVASTLLSCRDCCQCPRYKFFLLFDDGGWDLIIILERFFASRRGEECGSAFLVLCPTLIVRVEIEFLAMDQTKNRFTGVDAKT